MFEKPLEDIVPLGLRLSDGERTCKRHVHECKRKLVTSCFSIGQCQKLDALFLPLPKGIKQRA